MAKLRFLSIYLFLAITLSSCFISHFGNGSRWGNTTYHELPPLEEEKIVVDKRPDLEIKIIKKQRTLFLPFLFIDIDRKKYAILFHLKTYNNHYQTLDSISYQISDLAKNVLDKGKVNPKINKIDKIEESELFYQAFTETGFEIVLDKNIKTDLILKATLHLKDKNNNFASEEYNLPLKVMRPKWFQIGSFL